MNGEAEKLKNHLEWDRYREWKEGAEGYVIYRRQKGGEWKAVNTAGRGKRAYRDEDLEEEWEYYCYRVEALERSGNGRSYSTEVCLQQPALVHIPNSFSPGISEGLNDRFGPEGMFIKTYRMRIFNRWGQLIYGTRKRKPWDGNYKGAPVPEGTYLYHLTVIGEDGSGKQFTGSVNVLK